MHAAPIETHTTLGPSTAPPITSPTPIEAPPWVVARNSAPPTQDARLAAERPSTTSAPPATGIKAAAIDRSATQAQAVAGPSRPSTLSVHAGTQVAAPQVRKTSCEIPAGLTFEGRATYPCGVTVLGRVKGSIEATNDGLLHVAEGGEVDGEIKAQSITIDGIAKGTIDGSGGIVAFGAKSSCVGDILYARISVAEGAEVEATMKKAI